MAFTRIVDVDYVALLDAGIKDEFLGKGDLHYGVGVAVVSSRDVLGKLYLVVSFFRSFGAQDACASGVLKVQRLAVMELAVVCDPLGQVDAELVEVAVVRLQAGPPRRLTFIICTRLSVAKLMVRHPEYSGFLLSEPRTSGQPGMLRFAKIYSKPRCAHFATRFGGGSGGILFFW